MGMRVTTNMAMNLYRYNLQNSTAKMANSQNVISGDYRKFSSFAEDPTSAMQAWHIRRAMVNNASYQNNNKDTLNRFNVAYATMGVVTYNLVDKAAEDATIRGLNDPEGGARVQVGQVLKNTADSVIEAMNGAKYSDHFVFSGVDEMNAPFSWDGEKLYYRGVNVNAGGVKNPAERGVPQWALDDAGNEIAAGPMVPQGMPRSSEDAGEQAWIDYYMDPAANAAPDPAVNPMPAWADDGTAVPLPADDGTLANGTAGYERVVPEGVPEKSDDLYEQAWIDYYNDPQNAVKPTISPNDQGMAWGQADEFGVPEAVKNVTDQDTAYNRLWAAYYNDQGDVARLERLVKEEQNVDMGMGLEEKDGRLVKGSAFNRSIPGIQMLGYGVDENGDPNNVVLVMKRLGEIFENCHYETGDYDKDHPGENTEKAQALRAEANRLLDKLNLGCDHCISEYAGISTKAQFLEENQDRMKLQGDYLNEDRESIENYDPAEAISNFMYDYYCYNAALKVGTQLLSQSLIDYMN